MPKPLPPTPEPKPAFLRFTARDVALVLSSPTVVLVALALAASPGLVSLLAPQRTTPPPNAPNAAAQEWTTAASALRAASVVLGALPPPDPRQRKPPCAVKLGEDAIGGYCWIRLDIRPPCPQDPDAMAYEHNGKCYAYALKAAGVPTSGEPQRASIAGP